MSVLVVGNLIVDTVLRTAEVPRDGKVFIDSKASYVGGQAANGACALALLGLAPGFVTRVGNDAVGKAALDDLRAAGVDVDRSIMTDGADTMTATIIVDIKQNERTILMHRDVRLAARRPITAADAGWIEAATDHCDLVYLDGYHLDIALPIAEAARRKGKPVLSDLEQVNADTPALLERADILIAPQAVIHQLTHIADPGSAVAALLNRGMTTVIATNGAQGSCGISRDTPRPVHVPAALCTPVDTTGAGDAFHAGYIAGLLQGLALEAAMHLASNVAAAACETPGPRVSHEALSRRLPVERRMRVAQ